MTIDPQVTPPTPTSHSAYGYVTACLIRRSTDDSDPDDSPTIRAAMNVTGEFVPKRGQHRTSDYPALLIEERVPFTVGPNGYIRDGMGNSPIALGVGDWTAMFSGPPGVTVAPIEFSLTEAHTKAAPLNLYSLVPPTPPGGQQPAYMLVPPTIPVGHLLSVGADGLVGVDPAALGGGGVDSEAVQDIVGAMVTGAGGTYDDAAGTITLPSGGGSSTITADDTPAAPAEGESASYLVTSAVSWPAGLVWSTGPDGGVAPTITGSALVSLFTVGGVTRAILGATFPAAAGDTTAPSVPAGLTATATSATTVDLSWTASTDAVGVTGYEYRIGSGSAVDAGAGTTETVTGLTAGTLYSFAVRAYDAAGNRSAAWSTAATATTTAPDATPPVWTATLTPGTPDATSVVVTASALATDANAITYERTLDSTAGTPVWAAIVPSGLNFTLSGLTSGTVYANCALRAKDSAGNVSTPLAVPSFTSASGTTNQYATNFSEYGAGSPPSDWSQLWASTTDTIHDASGTKMLRTTSAGAVVWGALSWDDVPSAADQEVLVKVRTDNVSAAAPTHVIRLRASGASGGENGYVVAMNNTQLYIGRYISGTYYTLPSSKATFSPASSTWYWVRARINGSSLAAKVWADGGSEPDSWMSTATDKGVTGSAKTAIATGSASKTVDFGYFSVGLNGGVAP